MAIISGKGSKPSNEQAQLLPGAAPPPYTELPANNSGGASSSSSSQQQHPVPGQQQRYPSGPTAFSSLPPPGPALHARADSQYAYLSARAAARQADRRAARRLVGAVCWAVVLWTIMGAIVGGVVGNEVARRSQGHRRRLEGGWQIMRARRNRAALAEHPEALTVPIEQYASI
ncbi:hypothetical protein JCM10908_002176 [Rhodotorula pacifica]|uniref:uncharacterized protein n=1 Tax=Rhodotorula pacifica TaxID=1495444 RepID=UPI00317946EF